ncbi:MAG: dihydroneopterin aldolase [Balneolaceae bacterium]
MDIITVKSLTFHGKHGFYDEERVKGNQFEVDISAGGSFKASVAGDDLSATFNYELAEKIARDVITGPPEKLIEKLCFKIGEQIFHQAGNIEELNVTVRKLNPPFQTKAAYAEITMKWKR